MRRVHQTPTPELMKLKAILLFAFAVLATVPLLSAQNQLDCTKNCCAAKTQKTSLLKTSNSMTNTSNSTSSQSVLRCKLTTPELQQRKRTIMAQLHQQVIEKRSLPDGYAYRFAASDTLLDELTAFVKTERMCCDFFNFAIKVSSSQSVWLELTGPDGTKDFIDTEIEL